MNETQAKLVIFSIIFGAICSILPALAFSSCCAGSYHSNPQLSYYLAAENQFTVLCRSGFAYLILFFVQSAIAHQIQVRFRERKSTRRLWAALPLMVFAATWFASHQESQFSNRFIPHIYDAHLSGMGVGQMPILDSLVCVSLVILALVALCTAAFKTQPTWLRGLVFIGSLISGLAAVVWSFVRVPMEVYSYDTIWHLVMKSHQSLELLLVWFGLTLCQLLAFGCYKLASQKR